MTTKSLYWITRLTEIKEFLTGFSVSSTILCAFTSIIVFIAFFVKENLYKDNDEYMITNSLYKSIMPIAIITFTITLIVNIANMFIPTTKEYFVIKTLPAICSESNIDKAQKLIPEALDATSEWIKSLKEMKK